MNANSVEALESTGVSAEVTNGDNSSVGARQGSYYYAFGNNKSDTNFQAPKRITQEEAIEKEKAMKAGVSKWNANNYH